MAHKGQRGAAHAPLYPLNALSRSNRRPKHACPVAIIEYAGLSGADPLLRALAIQPRPLSLTQARMDRGASRWPGGAQLDRQVPFGLPRERSISPAQFTLNVSAQCGSPKAVFGPTNDLFAPPGPAFDHI